MHGILPCEVMFHRLKDRADVGRDQQVQLIYSEIVELHSLRANKFHKMQCCPLFKDRKIMEKCLIFGPLRLADDQSEGVQMIVNIREYQSGVFAVLTLMSPRPRDCCCALSSA